MKSTKTAYLFWLGSLIGFCGLNRLYVGKIGTGLLYFFTLGLCGLGALYDLLVIPNHVRYANLLRTSGINVNNQQQEQQQMQTQQVVVNVINNVDTQKQENM